MNLPPITLPQIPLPFEIPLLMHPPVVHFAIVLPIVVLLIEIINLFAQRRALSLTSLFLLIIAAVMAVGAYLTGGVDGKEAYALLSEAGQAELKEHKLLGAYLMLLSGAVLFFKLLSMLIGRGLVKAVYVLVLIALVAGILKQGKDGGELVYEFGANVEAVTTLDDTNMELQDEIAELKEQLAEKSSSEDAEEAEETPAPVAEQQTPTETNTTATTTTTTTETNTTTAN